MTDWPADTFAHYRVKLGRQWLHAVAMGEAEAVRKRLADDDPIWQRPSLELVACQSIDDWFGPFPAAGRVKYWLAEVE